MTKEESYTGPIHICDAINMSLEHIDLENVNALGIPSGYPSLDRLTMGWGKGELIIFGGRPCVGKTALALNMARNAAVDFGIPTAYFSLELSALELTDRLIVSETNITMEQLRGQKKILEADWQHMEAMLTSLSKAPLYIDDTPGLKIGQIKERIEDLAHKHDVSIVFVDYLHLILPDDGTNYPNREEETEAILHVLKELALALNVTIVTISYIRRPTRKNYTGPVLSDIDAYCPTAEYEANKIILVHRPSLCGVVDYWNEKMDRIELRLVQNKNGRTGSMVLLLDTERLKLAEWAS